MCIETTRQESSSPSQNRSKNDDRNNRFVDNDSLGVWNGAALLVADCMGTGLLALPHDVKVLGKGVGFFFLIANLPINWLAGLFLCRAADHVDQRNNDGDNNNHNNSNNNETIQSNDERSALTKMKTTTTTTTTTTTSATTTIRTRSYHVFEDSTKEHEIDNSNNPNNNKIDPSNNKIDPNDTATLDFVGMSSALFHDSKTITRLVMVLYYVNIFLVLGNYIVVMSHAVIAMLDTSQNENGIFSCTPMAGLIASTLMFSISQLRTMAKLGKSASIVSLLSLGVVVAQCLWFSRRDGADNNNNNNNNNNDANNDSEDDDIGGVRLLLRQLSALGSIGFAVGSQKLLLNIRHEFADRSDAPKSLAVSLTTFGAVYVFIIAAAGSDPPGFLFDTIPEGTIHRQAAGFLLWVHVAVSYAINSQALCASMDRNFLGNSLGGWSEERRWTMLTAVMASAAFFIANAIPFFKDLVAFCGAVTSVPLTLLLPALFYRRCRACWCKSAGHYFAQDTTSQQWASSGLLVFSATFMVAATFGSTYSILSDWEHRSGGFFSCR